MKKIFKTMLATVLSLVLLAQLATSGQEVNQNTSIVLGDTVTRAELAALLYTKFPNANSSDIEFEFSDLDESHWAYNPIQAAVNLGHFCGYSDGTFRPDKAVTYEEAVVVLCRAIGEASKWYNYPEDYIAAAMEYGITDNVNVLIGECVSGEDVLTMIENALEYKTSLLFDEDDDSDGFWLTKTSSSGGGSASAVSRAETATLSADMEDSLFEPMEEAEEFEVPYFNTEEYTHEDENIFKSALVSPLSTFSIDTDTASYSNLRRFVLNGQDISQGSIRTEELINYFNYTKAKTEDGKPFGVNYTVSECPWNSSNKLAMITVSGEELTEYKPSNLVFLIDTSGSMYSYNKLPLVKSALTMLLDNLGEKDMISIVTYASGTSVALEPTPATEKDKILSAINGLRAWGSTNGASGINLAYEQAEKFKLADGNNRIILCTDGDFNVGVSSTGDLEKLITQKRETGIYLSVLGFGMGNYKDNKMETLADNGNGNYAYIDTMKEAKKVLVDEMSKTIYTIAKDVKIQVEFNPAAVSEYRLIGYENRVLNAEDFANDKKDAGELGAGATVTVLYEIVPANGTEKSSELKYQASTIIPNDELMNVKIRYKEPHEDTSILSEYPIFDTENEELAEDFMFAAAVAELGMILNDSEYKGNADYNTVIELAREGIGKDEFGLRCEFVQLVDLLRYTKNH